MNIHRALSDVAEIRSKLDRVENYRGFRSVATGFSALFVLLGALIHSWIGPVGIGSFLTIWLGVAIASSLTAGLEMIVRGILSGNRQVWLTHRKLISSLLPALLVGAVLTGALFNFAMSLSEHSGRELIAMLPGMWAMLFGLGLFSCRAALPGSARKVAAYYLVAGMMCLMFCFQGSDPQSASAFSISSWQMIVLFGLGQSFLGLVLYWNVEREDG